MHAVTTSGLGGLGGLGCFFGVSDSCFPLRTPENAHLETHMCCTPCCIFCLQVKLTGGEVIGAPTPGDVMSSASRTVLSKLDKVEGEVIDFFMPAASRLIAGPHPERVLAAALAAMSGFR